MENFSDCIAEWNGRLPCKPTFSHVFSLKKIWLNHIDTRFYIANREFYQKYFSAAHLNLGGDAGMSIEDCFCDIILENNMKGVLFSTPPVIGGVGGGTGKDYNTRFSKKLKEVLRSKLTQLHPSFRHLYNTPA